jgi:transposase
MDHYAGIDVSLESSSVCLVDATGKVIAEAKVASEPEALVAWFRGRPEVVAGIGLEAGPLSQWLFAALDAAGLPTVLLETRHVRAAFKTMSVKTDRKDARGIAQLMRLGWFRPVHSKSVSAQETRALLTARIHDALYRRCRDLEGREESPSAAIIDSQSVKTGPDAREAVGFDAGKRVKGRKRHLLCDTLGLMMRVEVHSASVQDRDGAALVFDRIAARFPFVERFFADAGYQGPRVADAAPRAVEIIRRSDPGFVVQAKRWIVERTFAWITINRRLAKDFKRFAATVQTMIQISMIKLMSRRIARFRTF